MDSFQEPIFISQTQEAAENFFRDLCDDVTIYLDNELRQGFGLDFLYLVHERSHWVKKVIIITMNPRIQGEMVGFCKAHNISCEVF